MIRDAAAVGAGLAPARAARRIRTGERIHVVGVAGAGASAAALLADRAGASVTGCDAGGPSPYSAAVQATGIPVAWRHDPAHVAEDPQPDRLAVTTALTAVDPDHPELDAARRRGIPVEAWQQLVADAATGRTLVGIAGTHGKSTTSGWLVHVLVEAGADPSALVGALLPAALTGGTPATARWGSGDTFVVEADEYAGNFDPFRPDVVVVTSVEWDHPDVFADRSAVVSVFERWLRGAAATPGRPPTLVANAGDEGVRELLTRLPDWPGRLIPIRLVDDTGYAHREGLRGRIVAATPDGTDLALDGSLLPDGPVTARLPTAGRHNAANALGVAGAALALGLSPAAIVRGLASFGGVGRRLERKGEAAGVAVYDDYGHHPTAIRETLAAVRQRAPGRRVWAVYEPLTYHRTAALLDAFADVLATADAVAVADIWAGRDPDTTVASAAGLAEAVAQRRPELTVAAPGSVEETADWLAGEVRAGDVVLVMGGGRSYRIGERLLEQLEQR